MIHMICQILSVFTLTLSIIVSQAQAADLPAIPQSAHQNAWAKMEKLFILYVFVHRLVVTSVFVYDYQS